jgi:hypothetical protein
MERGIISIMQGDKEIILFLIIGFVFIISVIGYFLYSYYTRRSARSYYWKSDGGKHAITDKIKQKFHEHEEYTRVYKTAIGCAVQCRNIVRKVINELASLNQQKAEHHEIRIIDLQILSDLKEAVFTLQSGIHIYLTKKNEYITDEISKELYQLDNHMSVLYKSINSLLNEQESKRNDVAFLTKISVEADNCYQEIVRTHERFINGFQEYFSHI